MINDYNRIVNDYLFDTINNAEIDFYECIDNYETYDTFLQKLKEHEVYKLYMIQELLNGINLQQSINNLWEIVKDNIEIRDTHEHEWD